MSLLSKRFLSVGVLFLSMMPNVASGAEAERQSTKTDAAEIERLIEQLGSNKFAEREAAAKRLEAIGPPAVEALRRTAAQNKDPEIRRRVVLLLDKIENSLEQLVIDYQAYGLPLPPKDAQLVRYESGGGSLTVSTVNGITTKKRSPIRHSIGFLLQPLTKNGRYMIVVGPSQHNVWHKAKVSILEPEHTNAQDFSGWAKETWEPLGLAIQCKIRGWEQLARAFFQRAVHDDPAEPPRTTLRELAWNHWRSQLARPDTDWAAIARQLRSLLASERRLDNVENRSLLKSLDAALVLSKAKPGSIEAKIDDLIQVGYYYALPQGSEVDPRQLRVLQLGFDVVPQLIEHLDDGRLTRSLSTVRGVAADMLQGLAGRDLWEQLAPGQEDWTDANIRAWWKKAKNIGEEPYLLARVLQSEPGARWMPNRYMLAVIEKKYPHRLPSLYREVLEKHPDLGTWFFAEAVVRSSLPKDKKLDVLLNATRDADLERRFRALVELRSLAPVHFRQLLIENLERLWKSPAMSYRHCPETYMASLVLREDDPQLWELLKKVAKNSDVGLRTEILGDMSYGEMSPQQRQIRLKFLASFLDDRSIQEPVDSHLMQDRMEVRDFVALRLADILDIEVDPDKQQTDQDWSKLRAQVREALQRETAKSKKKAETTPKRGQ